MRVTPGWTTEPWDLELLERLLPELRTELDPLLERLRELEPCTLERLDELLLLLVPYVLLEREEEEREADERDEEDGREAEERDEERWLDEREAEERDEERWLDEREAEERDGEERDVDRVLRELDERLTPLEGVRWAAGLRLMARRPCGVPTSWGSWA